LSRKFNIFRSSEDYGSLLRRRLFIDIDPNESKEIRNFLYANQDEFLRLAERILTMPNLYFDGYKREYSEGRRIVSAMRFFDKENTRIYCQEMSDERGDYFIICAKRFGKKSQRNNKKNIPILKSISGYEYKHKK
jgi:hypothetical protein